MQISTALPRIAAAVLSLVCSSIVDSGEPEPATVSVNLDEVVVAPPEDGDPFRIYLRAAAQYADALNELNQDNDYDLQCGNPRTYKLGNTPFCAGRYYLAFKGRDARSRAELVRRTEEANRLHAELRARYPKLQELYNLRNLAADRWTWHSTSTRR